MPGVPMLFAGDELGLEGVIGEDSRRPMPWDSSQAWDTATLDIYAALAQVRRSRAALRRGGQRWAYVDDDTIAFVREHDDESPVVETPDGASVIPATEGPRLDIWALA